MNPVERTTADDRELVVAAQGGDRAAMEELLQRHHSRIHAICRRITANAADAEDATQETLIKVVRSLDGFDGRSAFGTWVHRIATNTALDEIRRRRRRPSLHAADLGQPDRGVREPEDPAAAAALDEIASQLLLDAAIADLPDDQRAAVVLRDSIGLDYAQIAEILGLPVGTVKSRISRARQRLMEQLAEQLDLDPDSGNRSTPAERQTNTPPGPSGHPPADRTRPEH